MRFRKVRDSFRCYGCEHKCGTYNNGKTYAVNGATGSDESFIWLKDGEYAPCGQRFNKDLIKK